MPRYSATPAYARYALALLLAVNLINYVDRQVLYAVFPLIKDELALSDTALGLLGSAFMLCYMVSAPVLGWFGDRISRVRLAAWGVGVWSIATALSAFAPGYRTLLSARTVVGVGEASFGTVSPGLLADYFTKERRGRVLAYFYLAIPVGSALGYLLGGQVGHAFGWHAAFLVAGVPGVLLTALIWWLREPERGGAGGELSLTSCAAVHDYRSFLRNRSFLVNTLAMAAMTFALGGLAQWVPTFLYRVHHLDVARSNTLFGAITVVAGILGTLTGGWLGDFFQKRSAKGYLLVSGWGFIIGAPFAAWAIVTSSLPACLAAIFVAEFFLFLNTGPLNTLIVGVTPPTMRAMAFAINIFFIHALGDAASPTIVGYCSDRWGLQNALLITPLAIVMAGLLCLLCMRFIEQDMARVEG